MWHEGKRLYRAFGISAVWRGHKDRQVIATAACGMCLGTVKRNKAVIILAVRYKACAILDETFQLQSHGLTWKKWILQLTNFLHPPLM